MQTPDEQLFTIEFAEVWSSAERRRGEFLAVWFHELRDRFRAAVREHQISMEPKFEDLERRLATSAGTEMELRQGV
jgi:hypothetical protein